MTLRNTTCLLTTFLVTSPVMAMEDMTNLQDKGGSTLRPVTFHIFKNQDAQKLEGHISAQTEKYYMGLIPISELGLDMEMDRWGQRSFILGVNDPEDMEDPMSISSSSDSLTDSSVATYIPRAFAVSTFENDQHFQNGKILHDSGEWPYETVTLFLNTKPLDETWEKLTANSEPFCPLNSKPKGSRLNNVRYVDKATRESHQLRDYWSEEGTVHYYSDVSFISSLLYKGGQCNTGVSRLKNAKYFKDELAPYTSPPLSYQDLQKNPETKVVDQNVLSLTSEIKAIERNQKLMRAHQKIEDEDMYYINTTHEKEIITMANNNKSSEEIDNYLASLKKRYQDEQSWLSVPGWINTLVHGEWRKRPTVNTETVLFKQDVDAELEDWEQM